MLDFGTFRGGTSGGRPFPWSGLGSRGPGFGVGVHIDLQGRRSLCYFHL